MNKRLLKQLTRLIAPFAIAMVALVIGCSQESQQAGAGFQRPPTPVEAALVTSQTVTDRFTTIGTIEADEAITVTSEIDGIVKEIPFREGGRLQTGDLIARLDDAQLKAEALRARAFKDQRQATYERVKSIIDQGAGASQDLDDALADLKVAEANLVLAETRLAKTSVVAPFAGLAGKRHISRGAFLRAGEPITDLAQIGQLRVTFAVPERLLASMNLGAEVSLQTTAYPDQVLTGTIDVIEPQLDQTTRNVGIVARVANPDELLRPGMSASVTTVLKNRTEALTVPSAAIFVEGGQAYVYVVKLDSIVTRTPISLGTRLAEVVEITEGLEGGQMVVKAGHQKLFEGAKVAPVTPGAAQ